MHGVTDFLRENVCLNPSNCNDNLEGTQGGFTMFLQTFIDKATILLKDSGTLSPVDLSNLQNYLSITSDIHLRYGFQTLLSLTIKGANEELSNTVFIFNYLHSATIIFSAASFFAMHSFQKRMREDIKQNCLLLLMIPQNIVKKQRSLKKYIKGICTEIKRSFGT
ncbi:hypothetical protein HMI55_006182 [Coelomomyces lativittatus]|nr:hypothetical protein HMI55_006182 [Coelomomyces lativittatus]